VALTGHRDGLRVTGSSDALRPLALSEGWPWWSWPWWAWPWLLEGQSKGSGSLGARSGTVATRHPQAGLDHDSKPLENRTLKTHRFQGNRGC